MRSASVGFIRRRGYSWRLIVAAMAAMLLALAMVGTVLAATTMGNTATQAAVIDNWSNFTVIDTNNPAGVDGVITQVTIFADRAGTVKFVIVDGDRKITQISGEINVPGSGVQTLTLDAPLGVTVGDNLGVHFVGQSTVQFNWGGEPAHWNNQGEDPTIGLFVGAGASSPQNRTYSMNAQINPGSPDLCKKGGWESYGYRNQGQCIASIVANENSVH